MAADIDHSLLRDVLAVRQLLTVAPAARKSERPEGQEELLQEDFTRVDRGSSFLGTAVLLQW